MSDISIKGVFDRVTEGVSNLSDRVSGLFESLTDGKGQRFHNAESVLENTRNIVGQLEQGLISYQPGMRNIGEAGYFRLRSGLQNSDWVDENVRNPLQQAKSELFDEMRSKGMLDTLTIKGVRYDAATLLSTDRGAGAVAQQFPQNREHIDLYRRMDRLDNEIGQITTESGLAKSRAGAEIFRRNGLGAGGMVFIHP